MRAFQNFLQRLFAHAKFDCRLARGEQEKFFNNYCQRISKYLQNFILFKAEKCILYTCEIFIFHFIIHQFVNQVATDGAALSSSSLSSAALTHFVSWSSTIIVASGGKPNVTLSR